VVIGLPVTLAGSLRRRQTDSQQGRRCRNFADAVAAAASSTSLTVFLIDERGTTMEAENMLYASGGRHEDVKRKKDSIAAALILSAYFADPSAAAKVGVPKILRGAGQRKDILQGEILNKSIETG